MWMQKYSRFPTGMIRQHNGVNVTSQPVKDGWEFLTWREGDPESKTWPVSIEQMRTDGIFALYEQCIQSHIEQETT